MVQLLTDAINKVRERHPFEIDARFILSDHLNAIWPLPDGDANHATRWRFIKEDFIRAYWKTYGSSQRTEVARTRGE